VFFSKEYLFGGEVAVWRNRTKDYLIKWPSVCVIVNKRLEMHVLSFCYKLDEYFSI